MRGATTRSVPPIAVIGMSGSFPMAKDIDEYWRNLCSGRECISFFPEDGDVSSIGLPDDEHFVPAGGFLEGVDQFDARFFGYSARDAEGMDPQHRIFLECAWHGLERAGYNPDTYPGLIGVYAGSAMSSYLSDFYAGHTDPTSVDDYGLAIGNDKDHLTTRSPTSSTCAARASPCRRPARPRWSSICMACQAFTIITATWRSPAASRRTPAPAGLLLPAGRNPVTRRTLPTVRRRRQRARCRQRRRRGRAEAADRCARRRRPVHAVIKATASTTTAPARSGTPRPAWTARRR